mgnify:CR=1 FL=1
MTATTALLWLLALMALGQIALVVVFYRLAQYLQVIALEFHATTKAAEARLRPPLR